MSRSVSWDDQRAFLAVLEEGSLSAAARRLRLSQPTVRSRIAALEAALGTTLFTRSINGLTPTDSARALAGPARAMSLASDVFMRAASAAPGEIAGAVRVSVSEFMGTVVIPPMLATLRARYPRITVELDVTNRPADLLGQEVDVAVRTFPPRQDALIARKVGSIPLAFFASADYLERRGHPQTVDDLAEHDLIGPDRSQADLQLAASIAPGLAAARFVLRTDSHPAQLAAARAGVGIAVVQVPVASRDPGLCRVLPDTVAARLETWIVTHEDLKTVAKVRAVFDHLVVAFTDFIGRERRTAAGARSPPAGRAKADR
jgi:DNA-binding transcriptional LysR family regulator